jgi:hypothetical protein
MDKKQGYLVISLDFELFWGMADKCSLEAYGPNVLGVRTALPRILERFTTHGIHATWATVGMLMARTHDELLSLLPPKDLRPQYDDMRLSSYSYIENTRLSPQVGIGNNESEDPYHYGPSLVSRILSTPHQEFANHTFSHFYVLDGNKNTSHILARDLDAHAAISKTYDRTTSSIVFPRNQVHDEALRVCFEKGITAYRGNENHFLYAPRKDSAQSYFIRGLRLLDHYLNISGHHTYPVPRKDLGQKPVNIPASRFLRPFTPTLSFLEPLRMRRIKRSMTYAAKHGEVFHLWWHPHNFGINQKENFKHLEILLEHFEYLRKEYGMQSISMSELAVHVSV